PDAIRAPRSCPKAPQAWSITCRTAALPAQASSMPTACEPCPGKTKAIFITCRQKVESNSGRDYAEPSYALSALHLDQHGTPGEPASNALHQNGFARFDAPIAAGCVESQ